MMIVVVTIVIRWILIIIPIKNLMFVVVLKVYDGDGWGCRCRLEELTRNVRPLAKSELSDTYSDVVAN